MSGSCDWCEGAGCDECQGKKASKGKPKAAAHADEWGDDAGGDDGWGAEDDGGQQKSGGVCEFCEGYGCDACQPDKAELTVDVQIANAFYEAESEIKENPKKSLEGLKKVLELSKTSGAKFSEETQDTIFKAMVLLAVLYIRSGQVDLGLKQYEDVMAFFKNVSHNESNKAVESVLNEVSNSKSRDLREKVYQKTVETLAKMPNKARMVFDIQMRRCTEFVGEKAYDKASKLLHDLHLTCKLPDGSDDQKNKGSELMDIYALEMKIAAETGAAAQTKELYEKTKDLPVAVKNPKSQSIIRECWGKMFGDEGQWQRAYQEFFTAFCMYQEGGQSDRAKQCLTYVVVSNMLSGGEQNVFDAREAAVYQKDEEMQPVINLRKAYEKRDVESFSKSLDVFNRTADQWLQEKMADLVSDFHKQYILKFVKPYRRLRITFLAEALRITEPKCEAHLIQMILDGDIHATIDQVKGLLDLTQQTGGGGGRKYQSLEVWAGTLGSLVRNLPQPQGQTAVTVPF